MLFRFTVTVEAERTEGKFATKDELAEQIQEAITDSDPGELEGENGGTYEIVLFEVEPVS